MRTLLISLILLPALALAGEAATTYKWVDEDGKVHYSDSPPPGVEAEEADLPPLTTVPPPATRTESSLIDPAEPAAPRPYYQALRITAPTNDQALWLNSGQLAVSLAVAPALRANHTVAVFLDGKQAAGPTQQAQVTLPGVVRGTHTLTAVIVDAKGQILLRSPAVTVHILKHSVATPP